MATRRSTVATVSPTDALPRWVRWLHIVTSNKRRAIEHPQAVLVLLLTESDRTIQRTTISIGGSGLHFECGVSLDPLADITFVSGHVHDWESLLRGQRSAAKRLTFYGSSHLLSLLATLARMPASALSLRCDTPPTRSRHGSPTHISKQEFR
jgi:hypothetical protein